MHVKNENEMFSCEFELNNPFAKLLITFSIVKIQTFKGLNSCFTLKSFFKSPTVVHLIFFVYNTMQEWIAGGDMINMIRLHDDSGAENRNIQWLSFYQYTVYI